MKKLYKKITGIDKLEFEIERLNSAYKNVQRKLNESTMQIIDSDSKNYQRYTSKINKKDEEIRRVNVQYQEVVERNVELLGIIENLETKIKPSKNKKNARKSN